MVDDEEAEREPDGEHAEVGDASEQVSRDTVEHERHGAAQGGGAAHHKDDLSNTI